VQQAAAELLTRVKEAAAAAISAGDPNQAELLTAAAADLGASPAEVAALRTQAQKLRAAAKAAGLGQLSLAFNERLANGRLLEPSGDSAKFYLAQLLQADAGDHATQLARTAFNARLLEEARTALRAQDYAGARRWLTEAHAAGADAAGISRLEAEVNAAQDETQQASGFVSASTLVRTHYMAPEFPIDARRRGIDGWVDLQFLVNIDGSVGELTVIGAQPVGIFEQAALDAVRRWRYQPAVRGGQPVTQRARLRMRFAMQR
jgi:TonB family protein